MPHLDGVCAGWQVRKIDGEDCIDTRYQCFSMFLKNIKTTFLTRG